MSVTVRLFALARQLAGRGEVSISSGGAKVADLGDAMGREYPSLGPLLARTMIAVNADYADDELRLPAGAEVAVIPPVSGAGEAISEMIDFPVTVSLEIETLSSEKRPMIQITEAPIDHAAVTERVRSNQAGAVCTFLGTTREMTGDRRTDLLEYEAYPEMAIKKLAELEAEAEATMADHRRRRLSIASVNSNWARSAS